MLLRTKEFSFLLIHSPEFQSLSYHISTQQFALSGSQKGKCQRKKDKGLLFNEALSFFVFFFHENNPSVSISTYISFNGM